MCNILAVFQHFRGMLVHSQILHGATAQIINIHITRKSQILIMFFFASMDLMALSLVLLRFILGKFKLSSTDMIFHLNSMPLVYGSFEVADSAT
jgi:hypothetical protein